MTQKEIIRNYLHDQKYENDGWVLGGTIRSLETRCGLIGFRGDRNCREMYEDHEIFAKEKNGMVYYKYKESFEDWVSKEHWKEKQLNLI